MKDRLVMLLKRGAHAVAAAHSEICSFGTCNCYAVEKEMLDVADRIERGRIEAINLDAPTHRPRRASAKGSL